MNDIVLCSEPDIHCSEMRTFSEKLCYVEMFIDDEYGKDKTTQNIQNKDKIVDVLGIALNLQEMFHLNSNNSLILAHSASHVILVVHHR